MKGAAQGWLNPGCQAKRLVVIGLDCAPPALAFDQFAGEMPHLQGLMARGVWGPLESVIPPITIPAWACAVTGCDPGQLGIYGFHQRHDHSYDGTGLVDSTDLRQDTVWDVLSQAGEPVIVVGVPPSYPPRRVNGCLVSCFLTPSTAHPHTYPAKLGDEIAAVVGDYAFDVTDFRSADRSRLLAEIRAMTQQHFALLRHLLASRPWTFAMMVEIGLDRMHHAFWSCFDEAHHRHQADGPHQHALRDYYRLIDDELGTVLAELDDDTAVMVISDHGAKRLQGGIAINEWLMQQGYLTLTAQPTEPHGLDPNDVDWSHTRAWAAGGYCGRLFLNQRGREPEGTVDRSERDGLLERLERELLAIPNAQGQRMDTRVYRPEASYRECRNLPPDLVVYFGNLDYRAIGSVGHGTVHLTDNDTGPDGANHDTQGIFVATAPGLAPQSNLAGLKLVDCARAMLALLGR
ncbi:MAG: alkaline phosphatase family protein [Deltaproteobacteria bacterium]|nr:alkaline phosphatase family protein [Deltaproteobacteria bacterium]